MWAKLSRVFLGVGTLLDSLVNSLERFSKSLKGYRQVSKAVGCSSKVLAASMESEQEVTSVVCSCIVC